MLIFHGKFRLFQALRDIKIKSALSLKSEPEIRSKSVSCFPFLRRNEGGDRKKSSNFRHLAFNRVFSRFLFVWLGFLPFIPRESNTRIDFSNLGKGQKRPSGRK